MRRQAAAVKPSNMRRLSSAFLLFAIGSEADSRFSIRKEVALSPECSLLTALRGKRAGLNPSKGPSSSKIEGSPLCRGHPKSGGTDGYSEVRTTQQVNGDGNAHRPGQCRKGTGVRTPLHGWKDLRIRHGGVGEAHRADRKRKGSDDLSPGRRRGPEELVANRDEYR